MGSSKKKKKTVKKTPSPIKVKPGLGKIETQLIDATGLKSKAKESKANWYVRLARAATELPDADWNKLSDPAQQWVNDTVEGHNAGAAVLAPSDTPDEDDLGGEDASDSAPEANPDAPDGEEAEDDVEEDEEKAAKPHKHAKEASSDQLGRGGIRRIRQLLIHDPEMSIEALSAKVRSEGFQVTDRTIKTTFDVTRIVLKIIAEEDSRPSPFC